MHHRFADPRSRPGDYRHFVLKPLHLVFAPLQFKRCSRRLIFLIPPFFEGESFGKVIQRTSVPRHYSAKFWYRTLEKNTQIRRRQDRLIQEDSSSGDLPLAVDFPQHIVARTCEQILTVLELRPI